jgi:hypothetical protein
MILLLIRILKTSYYSIDKLYFCENFDSNYQKEVEKCNYQLNDLIFEFLKKNQLKANSNVYGDQFQLDCINSFLQFHYKKRVFIYKRVLKFNVFKECHFIIFNLILYWGFILKSILIENAQKYEASNSFSTEDNIIICFGFPEHALNYEEINHSTQRNSFAEILLNEIKESYKLYTIDKYIRPSKSLEKNTHINDDGLFSLNVDDIRIISHINKNPISIILNFIKSFKLFYELFNTVNFYLYSFYLVQKNIFNKIEIVLNRFNYKGNISFEFYLLAYYDIGLIKYLKQDKIAIKYFIYSQNIIIPSGKSLMQSILDLNYDFNEKYLFETDSVIYSNNLENGLGFSENISIVNKLKEKVNLKYNLKLKLGHMENNIFSPSNLGFENIENITVDSNSILIFDVPIETKESTFSRSLTGDFTANSSFVNEFFSDIFYCAKKYHLNVYLKPKYSTSFKDISENIIGIADQYGLKLRFINPYSKIKLVNYKFNFAFHFPFTSTFQTCNNLSYQGYYYIPNSFIDNFFKHKTLILGSNNLNILLNKEYENSRG